MTGVLHIVVARKPVEGTVADNCLVYGCGALNVDGCRIAGEPIRTIQGGKKCNGGRFGDTSGEEADRHKVFESTAGRWPANLILDTRQNEKFPQTTSGTGNKNVKNHNSKHVFGNGLGAGYGDGIGGDSGSASRFFFNFNEQEADE